jgi:glycosyltransferase involved in cell wall biosynthesis
MVIALKILLMTQWFDPEPTFKGLLFAKELQAKGNEVEVITGFPNYPGGKVYDGYKIKLYQKEEIDGVVVHRVPLYPSHDGSALKRIVNYLSFFFASFFCGVFRASKPDVIYSYHPPLTTALSAMLVGFFRRRSYVVDIQDLWPDTLEATGMLNNKRVLGIVEWVCQLVYKRASRLIVLSPGFKKRLVEGGVSESKIDVIYNWCDEAALRNPDHCSVQLCENGNRNLLFAGNLGHAQGLPAVISAAKILQERRIPVNIVLVGDGVAKSEAEDIVRKDELENVFFVPRIPMMEVGSLLAKADMLLVHLTSDPLFAITIPSRTQAYMAVGKPIVMGVEGDASNIVEQADCGVICEPNNAQSIAAEVEKLALCSREELDCLGDRARSFYDMNMSVHHGVTAIYDVLEAAK